VKSQEAVRLARRIAIRDGISPEVAIQKSLDQLLEFEPNNPDFGANSFHFHASFTWKNHNIGTERVNKDHFYVQMLSS
jgi:hypothetical protein